MRQPNTTARAMSATLTALGAFAALPAFAQDTTAPAAPAAPTPPAPANGPGPATQPPPAPGTPLPGPTQPAPTTPAAPAATPPPNYGLQYNGLFDGYYLFQFNNPKNVNNITGRVYDFRHNSPALALAELNVFMNPKPNSFGFKATLDTGDTADVNALGAFGQSTGEARYKNFGQLYGTYAIGGNGAGIDFGKFYSPFGYEVSQSNGNYNYSRSLAYTLVPFYHTGFRAYTPSGVLGLKGLVATGYITQALYNSPTAGVADDNKQPAFIGQLNYTAPSGKFTLITTLGLAKDKLGSNLAGGEGATNARTTVSDNDFTYNFSAATLAGLDYTYAYVKPNGGNKLQASGYAVYFRQQLTPKNAIALRFSGYQAKEDNADTFRPYEITGTYEIKAAANFLTRFEYRHDHSNADPNSTSPNGLSFDFLSGAATPTATKRDQDTVSVSEVFTF